MRTGRAPTETGARSPTPVGVRGRGPYLTPNAELLCEGEQLLARVARRILEHRVAQRGQQLSERGTRGDAVGHQVVAVDGEVSERDRIAIRRVESAPIHATHRHNRRSLQSA